MFMKQRSLLSSLSNTIIFIVLPILIVSQSEISFNEHYSWSKPYSDYELTIIIMKSISLWLTIIAVFFYILCLLSFFMETKYVRDIDDSKENIKQGLDAETIADFIFIAGTIQVILGAVFKSPSFVTSNALSALSVYELTIGVACVFLAIIIFVVSGIIREKEKNIIDQRR